jgi:uncharacterized protein YoxC
MVYVSLYDLGITIIFLLIVIVSVYLISAIRKILIILDDVKQLLETNKTSIQETITLLPTMVSNVNQIVVSVKETAAQANDVIYDVRVEWETLIIYGKAVFQIIKTLFFKK